MARPRAPYPGAHPEPPPELSDRTLPILVLEVQITWFRLHRANHDALFFGRTGANRFDAPAGEFGVLYLAESPGCAFVETYGRSEHGTSLVTARSLAERCLSSVEFTISLHVVDITGAGLAQIGADNRLCTGEYRVAQRWALALWSHPEQPDGLMYRSRHDPSQRCLAIFNRATAAIVATPLGTLVEPHHGELLLTILDGYGFGLLDTL